MMGEILIVDCSLVGKRFIWNRASFSCMKLDETSSKVGYGYDQIGVYNGLDTGISYVIEGTVKYSS